VGYTPTGQRRRKYVYGRTKQEVLEKLNRLRARSLEGSLGDPGRLTLGQFLTRWLEDVAEQNLRRSTSDLYSRAARNHILPRLGGIRLASLTPAHIQNLMAEMNRCGAGIRWVTFRLLHRSLGQAVKWGLIPRNPADAVERPRPPVREMRTLTPEQARAFLREAQDDRYYALYCVLIGCGLRLGEALGLTWPDVDLEKGKLTVRQQLAEVGGRLFLQEPKTASARRTVDMPGFVIQALQDHQRRQEEEGNLMNEWLLVFTDMNGGPVRRENLRRRSFEPLLRRAGIPRIRLHDLRHTYATLNLAAGTHPKVVQQALGHANINITLQTYSHVLPTLGREAADRLDAILGSA
jgi:integrase